MIEIKSDHTPSCKIFLNDELFIDQTLPYNNCMLTWSATETIKTIKVMNTSEHMITANGVKIRPGQTMQI